MEQIKLMFDKIVTDNDFANEMQPLIEKGDVAAILAAAEKNGFSITDADWLEYNKWVEHLSVKTGFGEELNEESLEDVAGGEEAFNPKRGKGARTDPWISQCWFFASGSPEFKDGRLRKYCRQYACVFLGNKESGWGYYQCKCWGTELCKGNWHVEAGCV